MKHISLILILFSSLSSLYAQNSKENSTEISTKEIERLFPDSIKKAMNIIYPIFKVFKYNDKSGNYFCFFTENNSYINSKNDTFNDKIRAIAIKEFNGSYNKLWEINDFIVKNNNMEYNIWFWTKYMEFKDLDGDKIIDPIIIYGTLGKNDFDDGRLKIIIFYKGRKIAIRHQNGVFDFEREIKVDKTFYELPEEIQTFIINLMIKIEKNNQAIFPAYWQKDMRNNKTIINER